MRVWRIGRISDTDKLSGIGGLYVSGRWHFRGFRVLYTSSTPSLAALEILVHVDPAITPAGLGLLEIDIPDGVEIEVYDPSLLTKNWQDFPPPRALQEFGSKWLAEQRTAILCVPSVVMPIEMNYLINPVHAESPRISIVSERTFSFDPRLLN